MADGARSSSPLPECVAGGAGGASDDYFVRCTLRQPAVAPEPSGGTYGGASGAGGAAAMRGSGRRFQNRGGAPRRPGWNAGSSLCFSPPGAACSYPAGFRFDSCHRILFAMPQFTSSC